MPSGNPAAVVAARRNQQNLGTRLLDDQDGGTTNDGGAPSNAVATVQAQVDAVTTTMRDNVNVMVENIEKGSNLEARSQELADQAHTFSRTARRTSRHMWWQNCKVKLFCYGGIFLVLLVIVLIICGQLGAFDHKDEPDSPPP